MICPFLLWVSRIEQALCFGTKTCQTGSVIIEKLLMNKTSLDFFFRTDEGNVCCLIFFFLQFIIFITCFYTFRPQVFEKLPQNCTSTPMLKNIANLRLPTYKNNVWFFSYPFLLGKLVFFQGKLTIPPWLLTVSEYFWHHKEGLALSYTLVSKNLK